MNNRTQYLDKRLFVQLNGSRKVIGVLRGYDVPPPLPLIPTSTIPGVWGHLQRKRRADAVFYQVFLNIVLDEAVEEKAGGEKAKIGMVVRYDRI